MLKLNNIRFVDLSIFVNSSVSFQCLEYAGVFVVYCLKTNRAFFWGGEYVLDEIEHFFENLLKGSFKNKQLLEDFMSYGKESFQFFVLDCYPELENAIKRERALNYFKNLYSGDLY